MKAKRKHSQTPPPDPILHMMVWGSITALIITVIFVIPFVAFAIALSAEEHNASLEVLMIAIVGGSVGAIIGAVNGYIIKQKMPTATLTNNQRDALYIGILLFTMLSLTLISFPFFRFFLIIPALIIGLVMMYATHRYRGKLRHWENSLKEQST